MSYNTKRKTQVDWEEEAADRFWFKMAACKTRLNLKLLVLFTEAFIMR